MAVILERIDVARNMRRFYRLDVQPTLCSAVFDSEEAAEAAWVRQWRVKERLGYQVR